MPLSRNNTAQTYKQTASLEYFLLHNQTDLLHINSSVGVLKIVKGLRKLKKEFTNASLLKVILENANVYPI